MRGVNQATSQKRTVTQATDKKKDALQGSNVMWENRLSSVGERKKRKSEGGESKREKRKNEKGKRGVRKKTTVSFLFFLFFLLFLSFRSSSYSTLPSRIFFVFFCQSGGCKMHPFFWMTYIYLVDYLTYDLVHSVVCSRLRYICNYISYIYHICL